MPDWLALLADRFPRETLQPCKHQEVLLEISGHLQDYYDALVSEGIAEADAAEQTLRRLGDMDQFELEIDAAKHEGDPMNRRTKSFWLPGSITLTGSMGWLLVLQGRDWPMSKTLFHASPPLIPFVIWLCTLPIFGALGAYLSRRGGGSVRARLGAAVFPSIAMLGLLICILPFALFVERNPFVRQHPGDVVLIFLPWVVFPALALLAGSALLHIWSGGEFLSH
ncbi:MAG: permease prefix domain 1-containing protein [Candidatus Acidiferrum sp.]